MARLLQTDDADLLRAVVDVLAAHSDWAEQITGVVATWLALPRPTDEQLATVRGAILALSQRPAVQKLVADALDSDATAKPVRLMLLEVLAAVEHDQMPTVMIEAVRRNLASSRCRRAPPNRADGVGA